MVTVDYIGGLGNILFQYSFSRILAEKLGYRLNAPRINGFSSADKLIDGHAYQNRGPVLTGQKVDIDSIVNQRPESNITCRTSAP